MAMSKKAIIITATVVVILLAALGVAAYYFANKSAKVANNDKVDTSQLPDGMKKAIKDDLNITPEQYMVRAKVSAKLDDFQTSVKTEVKQDLAGVYIDEKGTPHVDVTSEKTKQLLEKAKTASDTVPIEARSAIKQAKQAIELAKANITVQDAKTAIDKAKEAVKDDKKVQSGEAAKAVQDAKKIIDDVQKTVSSSEAKVDLGKASAALVFDINIGGKDGNILQQLVETASQAVNAAVQVGTQVVTTALQAAKQVVDSITGVVSSAANQAITQVASAINTALNSVTSGAVSAVGSLINTATQLVTTAVGVVNSIIELPLNITIGVVPNSSADLDKTIDQTKAWIDGLPDQIKSQVLAVAKNTPDNDINLILKKSSDPNAQLSLPQGINNVNVVEVRSDLQVGFPDFNTAQKNSATENATQTQPAQNTPAPSASSEIPVHKPADGNYYGGTGYGIKVSDTNFTYCSMGFNAKDEKGNPVVLTAGHCAQGIAAAPATLNIADGYGVDPRAITNIPALQFVGEKYSGTPSIDVGLAKVVGDKSKFNNAGVRTSGDGHLNVTGTATPVWGAPVCKFGQTTAFTCGTTFFNNINLPIGLDHLTNWTADMFLTNACVRGGDSGGAFVSGTNAVGTLSGGPSALFAFIPGVATAPCTNNSILDQLVGNWSLVTPIAEHLKAFPGVTINTAK